MGIDINKRKCRPGPIWALTISLLLLFTILRVPISSGYWTEWRGGPQHLAKEEGELPEAGELIWSYQTGNQVLSSPVFYEGGMVIGSDDWNLYCFDPDTGEMNWKFKTSGEVQASALIHDGRAYFGSFDKNFYCIDLPDPGSGSEPSLIWNITVSGQIISSAHIFKDSIIFADTDGFVYRVAIDDGEVIWEEGHTLDQFWATPLILIEDEKLIIGDIWNHLFVMDANDGSLLSETFITMDTEIYSSGTVSDGMFFFTGGMDRSLHAFNIESEEIVWSFNAGHDTYSTPIVDNGRVYFGSFEYLWCLPVEDPDESGNISEDEVIWSAPTYDFQGGSSPFIAGDRIFVGSDDYNLYCFNKTNGEEIWTFETRGYIYSSPALYDRKVYFGSSDRNIYCIGKRPPGLVMEAEVEFAEITSDNITVIDILITDDEGGPVNDVVVSFITSAGFIAFDEDGNTRLEHKTDSNGELQVYFHPVQVSSRSTIDITMTAQKEGLQGTRTISQVIVEPGENGKNDEGEVGDDLKKRVPYIISIIILTAINIILGLLGLLWFVRNVYEKREVEN